MTGESGFLCSATRPACLSPSRPKALGIFAFERRRSFSGILSANILAYQNQGFFFLRLWPSVSLPVGYESR